MMLRFGSKEESELAKLLYDTFDLGKILKVKASEIKSLDNANGIFKSSAKHLLVSRFGRYCTCPAFQPI